MSTQWVYPSAHAQIDTVYASPDFKRTAYHALSGAVRIPLLCLRFSSPLCSTESRDGSGPVGQDPVWHPFADLHSYPEQTFPRVSVPPILSFPRFIPSLGTTT
jgi:Gly-Xaa carboxypeptidase